MDDFSPKLEKELQTLYAKAKAINNVLYHYPSKIDDRFSAVKYTNGFVTIEFHDSEHERDRNYILRGTPDSILDAITIWKLKRD